MNTLDFQALKEQYILSRFQQHLVIRMTRDKQSTKQSDLNECNLKLCFTHMACLSQQSCFAFVCPFELIICDLETQNLLMG